MKSASIQEIKQSLQDCSIKELTAICLRLAKYKKDNKELITYLLYEAGDEVSYIENVKREMKLAFEEINHSSLYYVKKSLRKILRIAGKYSRYSGKAETEIELLFYFLEQVKFYRIPVQENSVIMNMIHNQQKKLRAKIATLHEDLQFDYGKNLEQISGSL